MFACTPGCGKAKSLQASVDDLSGSNLGGSAPSSELFGSNLQTRITYKDIGSGYCVNEAGETPVDTVKRYDSSYVDRHGDVRVCEGWCDAMMGCTAYAYNLSNKARPECELYHANGLQPSRTDDREWYQRSQNALKNTSCMVKLYEHSDRDTTVHVGSSVGASKTVDFPSGVTGLLACHAPDGFGLNVNNTTGKLTVTSKDGAGWNTDLGFTCKDVKSEFTGFGLVPMLVRGKYSFTFQPDGNLVLYDGDNVAWASNTDKFPGGNGTDVHLLLQHDGNMVIQRKDGYLYWASHTRGAPGPCKLVLQSDRNVVLYDKNGVPRWDTGTAVTYDFSVVGYTHDKDWAGTGRQKCAVSVQFFVNGAWEELRPFITEEVLPLDIVKVNYSVPGSARPTKLRFVNTSRDQVDGWGTTKVAVEFNRRLATCTAEQGPKEYYWVKNDDLVMDIPAPSANDPMFTRPADVPEVMVRKGDPGVKIEKLTAYPYTFTQQADGNICLYEEGKVGVLWASGTVGQASADHELILQGDGNLVSYANGKAIWASNTSGTGPFLLVMQLDGNVVLYNNGNPMWNTGTRQG